MPPPGRRSRLRVLWDSGKITVLLIVANIAVYYVLGLLDTREGDILDNKSFLIAWGANVPPLTLSAGEYWRLFTSMFMHVGRMHLFMNMLALWSLGLVLERRMRWPVFLGVYLLSGLCGSLTTALWHDGELFISCGASGAILGLFGAALAYTLRDRSTGRLHFPVRNLVASLVLTFGAGVIFPVDNAAHAGGLVSGFLLALAALYGEKLRPAANAALLTLTALATVVALAGVTLDNHAGGLSDKLAAARLLRTLKQLGLVDRYGGSGYTGISRVNACAMDVIRGEDSQGNPLPGLTHGAGQVEDLHRCGRVGEDFRSDWPSYFARYVPLKYDQCRAEVADLRDRKISSAALNGLAVIDRACTTQRQIYVAIYGKAPPDLDLQAAYRAYQNVEDLLNEKGQGVQTRNGDRDKALSGAVLDLLNNAGPMATELVRQADCPYFSCKPR